MKLAKMLAGLIKVNIQYIKNQFDQKIINTQTQVDYRDLYATVHQNSVPVFVLSTGRCGTELLTQILQKHSQVGAYHVPAPELVYFSRFAYENYRFNSDTLTWLIDSARYELIRDNFLLDRQYIETNNRITFFAYQLAELYPQSRFIHLVRHPLDFIKSGWQRNWYTGRNIHDEGRIVPVDASDIEWKQFNTIEKIAWLWNETNQFIEEFKGHLSASRTLTVLAEHLFQQPVTTTHIFKFLDQQPLPEKQIYAMIQQPVNVGKKHSLNWQEILTDDQLNRIQKLTPLAATYNYTW